MTLAGVIFAMDNDHDEEEAINDAKVVSRA